MTRYRILPYRPGSRSAGSLARALGGMCLRLEASRFIPRARDVIINWGNTNPPRINDVRWYNGEGLRDATNKLSFFQRMASISDDITPAFWTRAEDTPDTSFPIVCRTVLAGHSGEGIVLANTREELVPAPLYVQYVKKQDEYRVHVGKRADQSIIIDIQQKKRRTDHENPNYQIRNHANGFIYAREGIDPPQPVIDVACRALAGLPLDFGAVDVIWNQHQERAYVLEVNTAPGLEGTTVERYRDFFWSLV